MSTIYAHATRVIVWLGEASNDNAHALYTLSRAVNLKQRSSRAVSAYDLWYLEDVRPTTRELEAIVLCPWFKRVWVCGSIEQIIDFRGD
jgi:hypothetical protein